MYSYSIEDILSLINQEYELAGTKQVKIITNFKSILEADEASLVWCSPDRADKKELITKTKARWIICDKEIDISDELKKEKAFIKVDNPKYVFSSILRNITNKSFPESVHPSAIIHPEASIGANVYIGPNSTIGKCTVGENTIIHGHCFIYDGVEVGKDVTIEAGVVLGAEGFGMAKDNDGHWHRFPHIGKLIIADQVEIGANTTIDRGTLGNTRIGFGSKISKSVRVAHNVTIGSDCIITGGVVISGSVSIGNNVWVGPNASILNKITIEDDVAISISATVTKSVKKGYQVIGTRILEKK